MPSETHIEPVMVGDPEKCKEASDLLLAEHASMSSRSIVRRFRAAPNGFASRRRPTTMTR
jgi:7-keto-8-aminopelargonate synthetase-like enzyme